MLASGTPGAASRPAITAFSSFAATRWARTGGCLKNLGTHLSELGRHEEALVPTREATDLYRDLDARRPNVFKFDHAMALNNRKRCSCTPAFGLDDQMSA